MLLNKFEKSTYVRYKLINLFEDDIDWINDIEIPTGADNVENQEMDRSTLYSFNRPFQLLHVDVANLEFLGKLASVFRCGLLVVDL